MKNPRLVLVSIASVLLGCTQPSSPPVVESVPAPSGMDWEMQWAQAALERNPNLEVLSADRERRAFTIRELQTAQTTEVQLAQIAAAPLEFLSRPSDGALPQPAAPKPTPKPAVASPAESESLTRLAEAYTPAPASEPQPKAPNYTIERSGGRTRVIGAGISIIYGDTAAAPSIQAAALDEPAPRYSIDRSSGLVRANGPGVSLEMEPAAGDAQSLAGAEVEPVICEGPRVMQLDSRTIQVDGDALTARGGCELYITNSTIVASGTAVVIGDATVHINNSRIAGGLASFDAKERAKVFLRGSTLNGVPRRNGQAVIQDQGGNNYR